MLRQAIKANRQPAQVASAGTTVSIIGIDEQTISSVAALVRGGFRVICADADPTKVDALAEMLRSGTAGLALWQAHLVEKTLCLTDDPFTAVMDSSITLICQGAGESFTGEVDTYALSAIGRMIGSALAHKDEYHVIIQQASVEPGTTRGALVSAIEAASGLQAGAGFGACHLSSRFTHLASGDGAPLFAGVTDLVTASMVENLLHRAGRHATTTLIEISEMKGWVACDVDRISGNLPRSKASDDRLDARELLAALQDTFSLTA